MNKFEALKEFQGWPADSQRLCAEYWIEMGDVDPKFVLAFPKQVKKNCLKALSPAPMAEDLWPFDQPEAEKAAKVAKKPRSRTDYTLEELDFLDSLIHCGVKPTVAIEKFCKRFPNHGHPVGSLPGKLHERKKKLRDQGDL